MDSAGSVRDGFHSVQVWATYMPVKNSPAEARAKAAQNAPTHSATHSEFSMYDAWGRLLRAAGATVTAGAPATFNGLEVTMCPFISFAPSFICSLSEIRVRGPPPACVPPCVPPMHSPHHGCTTRLPVTVQPLERSPLQSGDAHV